MTAEVIGETPFIDIFVDTWASLVDALHSSSMMPNAAHDGGHRRSPFVFRGMSDATWPVRTSLERLGSPSEVVERPLLRNFKKYARPGTFARDSEWELLAVAQHNGLPTRCLDWTGSPLVAAHFATAEPDFIDKDAVIWCLDATRWRDSLLVPELKNALMNEHAWLFDVRILERSLVGISDFDTQFKTEDVLLLFEPPSIDSRIENQAGVLSLLNGPTKSHHSYLRVAADAAPGCVVRIIIAASAKREVRDMLDQSNITERMLFPGLPGLAKWMQRYYSPA